MSGDERHLIQIEAEEDPNSVKDRLSFYKGQRVLLIWPEEGTALTRKLDLILIQREAMRRQLRLAFVTHDPQVIEHAKDLNISTFQTIGASERGRWRRGRSRVFTGRERRPTVTASAEELEEVASRKHGRERTMTLGGLLTRFIVLGVLLGIGFGVFYFTVPSATITLTPAMEQINTSVQITVNPDANFSGIDIENAILPATRVRIEIEETASIPTTGTQSQGDASATGEVVFINRGNTELTIPAETAVSTSAGAPIMFRTVAEVTLPAGEGAEVSAEIEAAPQSVGAVGNVDANLINTVIGELNGQISVINPLPTSGGETRSVSAVSAGDRERLEAQMNQLLQQRAYTEMQELPQIGTGQYIVLETLRIVEERDDWTRYSAEIGEAAETLTLSKRAVVEAVVVDTGLGQQIVFARMAAQVPRGRVFDPDSINYTQGEVRFDGDLILFTMSGTGRIIGRVNDALIRSAVAHMTLSDALDYLIENADIQPGTTPQITVEPDLFGRLPIWTERITIIEADGE